MEEHKLEWAKIWEQSDIKISGDNKSQQAIRFNIFKLNQTYRGDNPNLNFGPKGFTGENMEEVHIGIQRRIVFHSV